MSQDLNSALSSAAEYILSGTGIQVAAAEAGEEFSLNPKLVLNRLLARHSATVETLVEKLLAAQGAISMAAEMAAQEKLTAAKLVVQQIAGQYRLQPQAMELVGRPFELKGVQYLYVVSDAACTAWAIRAVRLSDAAPWKFRKEVASRIYDQIKD
ncbi:hypothetical protein [Roseococcus pinisoli]|uniref:Uncharacterized protein n=1 Tax=Roseococcus pinisoli TaxID=2835040 RepID=A0ABS5QFP8_9PROT|nr:hypothetical protein [Roseococcus pinisoli]MBS7812394.1 hypothetical protein [Roseococcus pinisoli]